MTSAVLAFYTKDATPWQSAMYAVLAEKQKREGAALNADEREA